MDSEKSDTPEVQKIAWWASLDRQDRYLWRVALVMLFVLATALALVGRKFWAEWPSGVKWAPAAGIALTFLFIGYLWKQSRQIAAVRRLVRSINASKQGSGYEPELEKLLDTVLGSQRLFRETIDSLDHAVFTLSLQGEFQVVNRRCIEILGTSFQDVIHRPFYEFLSEPSRAAAEAALPDFIEKKSWSGVLRFQVKKTGEIRHFNLFLSLFTKDGQTAGVSGIARDVTSQRESELQFSELVESLQEGVYFTDPDGKILEVNASFAVMLGYERKEDLVGLNIADLYADSSERRRLLSDLKRRGSTRDFAVTLRHKDGSKICCLDSCAVIRGASGRVERLRGTMVDITDRIAIEKRLHQEQEFVRRLIASFPDTIGVLDTAGKCTFISSRVEEQLGYAPNEIVGSQFSNWVDPKDRRAMFDLLENLLSGKSAFGTVEYRIQHKDGEWKTFRTNACPLSDADGKIIGVVVSARDMTESKQFERQLLQREKLAAMGQMIAGVAHELNNPLTAILGVSDLLRERPGDNALRRQTELVHQQARRAADIVQKLLSVSRPSGPGRSRVDLEELARRAVALQESKLKEKQIEVQFSADPNLPPADGDSNLLLQVIQNLIVNAYQAISSMSESGDISIDVSQRDRNLILTIQDDGPGIRPEIIANIFDPFFTTKRPGGGAGLGLTISMAVAKDHGGTIDVRSTPGEGATFRLILPIAERDNADSSQPTLASSAASLQGHSVLVVDDEEGIRELVAEGLSVRGMAVESVATSEEALAILGNRSFDAILCDFNLPGLNGEALFERLRQQPGGSPARFVFMTGELLNAEMLDSFAGRGARVLQKPFQLAGLAAILGEVLEAQPARAD